MNNNRLKTFQISGFKKFTDLKIDNIGQFNLIIGQNNVGKTTLLEALLLSQNIDETLQGLLAALAFRDISFNNIEDNLFKGMFNKRDSFSYTLGYDTFEDACLFEVKETSSLQQSEIDALNLKNIGNRPLPYVGTLQVNNKKPEMAFIKNQTGYSPFVSYKTDFEKDLFDFYSNNIQISKSVKEQFLNDLKLLIPDIESIELGAIHGRDISLIVTLRNTDMPITINDFGGGTIKYIRFLLELFVCENKRLMIDEIDTGIHYSKLSLMLNKILSIAAKKNVQLFTTTHSKECIESFITALEETGLQNEGRIIRLAETKHGIKAYTMEFAEFENALLAESEIR